MKIVNFWRKTSCTRRKKNGWFQIETLMMNRGHPHLIYRRKHGWFQIETLVMNRVHPHLRYRRKHGWWKYHQSTEITVPNFPRWPSGDNEARREWETDIHQRRWTPIDLYRTTKEGKREGRPTKKMDWLIFIKTSGKSDKRSCSVAFTKKNNESVRILSSPIFCFFLDFFGELVTNTHIDFSQEVLNS